MQIKKILLWKKILGFLSIAGFVLSLTVDLLTFTSIESIDNIQSNLLLHIGLFIVIVPIIFLTSKEKDESKTFSDIPKWAQYLMLFLFIYAVVNYVLADYTLVGGSLRSEGGQYILHSHGTIIRQLTEAEYNQLRAYNLRGLSGIWILFYFMGVSFYILKPTKQSLFNNP